MQVRFFEFFGTNWDKNLCSLPSRYLRVAAVSLVLGAVPTTEPSVKRWRAPKVSAVFSQPEDWDRISSPRAFALINDPAFLDLQPLGKLRRG
jgi:hypothetical protein